MQFLYKIHQKAKPALLLMVVVAIILGSSFLEKRLMKDINTSVSSIYNDRLIPAAELFHINDLMYNKRLILEKYLVQPSLANKKAAQKELASYTNQINSLIKKFETTYLVDEESKTFQNFKEKLNRYNALEIQLLVNAAQTGIPQFAENEIAGIFTQIHKELVMLSDIQVKVGEELVQDSEATTGSARILSNLQIAIVLIITLMVQQALIMDSNPLIPKNLKNFRLN
ncbi:MCP four helix bundle domain-containing protein [Adhaeribacter radiodurans]|uniref:MCP four helix bundle domain-containing protein n=1 Tax=Adhaeribacter radiodurans TaxID=2745197 RepID=A0A7L7L4R7_9BACT|nr:MCP four helix bundle domain-containing protein [Adhaeribacter radiodurans]QMU27811.1 MCP four helix bundle domain-containing protein [Adhaeribacter radiodurans]